MSKRVRLPDDPKRHLVAFEPNGNRDGWVEHWTEGDTTMFILSADIDNDDDTEWVCCFDPTVVVVRFRRIFPEVEVIPQDFAWRDYDLYKQRGVVDGAVRVAENDPRRRTTGPITGRGIAPRPLTPFTASVATKVGRPGK